MNRLSAPPAIAAGEEPADVSTELAARRTGMSFQRTRMSADRTLMSVIRTSLSLIGFGFTIYQVFRNLEKEKVIPSSDAARNFGVALILIGIAMVVAGIVFQLQFMRGLRRLRNEMAEQGLIHAESKFPASYTLVVAVLLLILGIVAIATLR
jgi:putative membrane protein